MCGGGAAHRIHSVYAQPSGPSTVAPHLLHPLSSSILDQNDRNELDKQTRPDTKRKWPHRACIITSLWSLFAVYCLLLAAKPDFVLFLSFPPSRWATAVARRPLVKRRACLLWGSKKERTPGAFAKLLHLIKDAFVSHVEDAWRKWEVVSFFVSWDRRHNSQRCCLSSSLASTCTFLHVRLGITLDISKHPPPRFIDGVISSPAERLTTVTAEAARVPANVRFSCCHTGQTLRRTAVEGTRV